MRFFKSNKYSKANTQTDLALIDEYKRTGDNEIIAVLFDRYAHLIYALCMKYFKDEEESRDAVINIFEKLLVSLKRYDIKNFTTWIHSVAKNYCLARLQESNQNEKTPISNEHEYPVIDAAANEEEQQKAITLDKLNQAILSLNSDQRTCIELFYFKKQTYTEISKATGYSLNQVKSYIQNGKRNLKINMGKKNER